MMQYMYENGCPWDCETIENAILWNEIDCLKFAFENGCIPNKDGISKEGIHYYELSYNEDCIGYLKERGIKNADEFHI